MRNIDINIDPVDVLDQLNIDDVVEHYSTDALLEEIGIGKTLKYFYIDDVIEHIGAYIILEEINDDLLKKYAMENFDLIEAE